MVRRMTCRGFIGSLLLLPLLFPRGGIAQPQAFEPSLFARVTDDGRHRVIMHIGPGSVPGSMLVLTRNVATEFDGRGKQLRRSRFPNELWRPLGARFSPEQPLQIIGLKSGFFSSWIDVLDLDSRRIMKMTSWQDGYPELADVLGDTANEVLVRLRDGVAVLDRAGKQVAFVRSPRYMYQFQSIAVPNSPKRAIAMWMWRDNKRGTDIAVYRADGSVVGEWNENPSDRLSAFALHDGVEGLWSAFNDRFVERSPTGVVRREFAVPGMGHYRHVYGGALAGGRVVLIGSPPGSTLGSLVCIFASDGKLLSRTLLPVLTWSFYLPDPNGTIFYVGNNEDVLRFDVASLPAASLP